MVEQKLGVKQATLYLPTNVEKVVREVPLYQTAAVTESTNVENPTLGVRIVESFKGPEKIGADEVLVKMIYSSVNHIDWMYNTGKFWFQPTAPFIGGRDGCGIVVKIGENCPTSLKINDVVCGVTDNQMWGTFGQYAIFKWSQLALKPDTLPVEHAAGLPLVLLTAWETFQKIPNPSALKRILIHGGAGGVGSWLILLAKYYYNIPEVITTCRDTNTDYVKELGADRAINYNQGNFDTIILQEYTDVVPPLDAVMDTVGGDEILHRSYNLLDKSGFFITTVTMQNFDKHSVPVEYIGFGIETLRNKLSHVFANHPAFYSVSYSPDGTTLAKLLKWVSENRLDQKLQFTKYPLNEITTALEQIHSFHTDGKIIVDMTWSQ